MLQFSPANNEINIEIYNYFNNFRTKYFLNVFNKI